MGKRRIGIVGFGHLGQFLTQRILENQTDLELAFVWNRSKEVLNSSNIPKELILENLEDCATRHPDLIVEVAHPIIVEKYGSTFLKACDFMLGSPTVLAKKDTEIQLRDATKTYGKGLYVPSGALWGGEDIRKMADLGTLKGLTVTMKKHPDAFKLNGALAEINSNVKDIPVTLYEGPVRDLCPQAPNNVNTMAAAAIAASNLGLDVVVGKLVSDRSLRDWHIVEVELFGPTKPNGNQFSVKTVRCNPADPGVVTGSATYNSFLSSIYRASNKGPGVHLC